MARASTAAAGPIQTAREFDYRLEDFQAIAKLLEERTGIHLPAHKDQLVYSRLAKRLRALNITSFSEYRALLSSAQGGPELLRMVNALTTNLTRFFREAHHFEHLRKSLGTLAQGGPRRLRIWSAGCSTGPEPYSIALTLAAAIPEIGRWDAKILATDIDTDVLSTAEQGRYPVDDIDEMPQEYMRYLRDAGGGKIEIVPEIRRLITFKPLNLIGPWPFKGPFDCIFCRNVAIYFTAETQAQMFARMHDVLSPSGHLYIGHSETLTQLASRFELVGQTIYRPR